MAARPVRYRPHRPLRAVAALGGVLVALVLGVLAWWCWHRGVSVSMRDGIELRRLDGSWITLAVAAATLAGIAFLNAVRHALLAVRVPGLPGAGTGCRPAPGCAE